MKIGILSDTHDQVERASRAVSALIEAGAETIIHCGDITGRDVVLECGGLPSIYVFGNNDYDHDELRRAILEVGGRLPGSRGGRSSWTVDRSRSPTATRTGRSVA